MKPTERISLLVADVEDEIRNLEKLRVEFEQLKERVDLGVQDASPYDKAVVGYYLHNFYNGCENIFRSIARFFENDLGADSWHADLLKRMKLDVGGYRPRVIDDALFMILDDFRAFRHKFRHCYTFELDWAKEKLIVEKYDTAHARVIEQVRTFLDEVREIGDEEDS